MLSPGKHYENFPVASVLLPASLRQHVAAVYAFARAADDFADEGDIPDEERLRLLDGWGRRLRHAASGSRYSERPVEPGEPDDTVELFMTLGATIRDRSLPLEPFEDLLSAFRQDVRVKRYDTWDSLLDYCRRSANPIGRIVLALAGYRESGLEASSDALCTALQLTNFWQDVKIDFDRGRIYLPAEELARHGAAESDLAGDRITPAGRAALSAAAARTRGLFADARAVCDGVPSRRLRYELRATWLGGSRILDRLAGSGFDVITRRPTIGAADVPWLAVRLLTWRSGDAATPARDGNT